MDVEGRRRVTIQEAARIMGVSEGAIRKRVKRDTLDYEKGLDGRIYVYLPIATQGVPGGVDKGIDEVADSHSTALISQMQAEIEYLREENRRKDTIIMNMTEAMKAISPPASEEPRESPVTDVSPGRQGRSQERPFTDKEGAQEPVEPRPWWRRMFGG
jgi:hypothetical protein